MTREEIALVLSNGIDIRYISEEETSKVEPNEEKEEYGISDCVLVRTTDIFPRGKIIQTPEHGHAQTFARSEIFGDIIMERIRSKYPKVMSEEEEKSYLSELSEYEIPFDITRSTIHFTMNGLVSSHAYGDFSNRPYIILEPFDEHYDRKSLIGLRVEDTYFNDDIELSERAIIMINKESFIAIMSDPYYVEELKEFNVVVFEGDEKKAVEHVLHSLGYNAFTINNHGYVDGLTSGTEDNKMYNSIREIATKLGVSQDRHFGSSIQREDFDMSIKKEEERNKEFLNFVLDNTLISEELKEKLQKEAKYKKSYQISNSSCVEQFIDEVGLDNMKTLVQSYNNQLKENIYNKNTDKTI